MKPIGFADLADMPEDERIAIIGRTVVDQQKTVGVCVDATLTKGSSETKADRYKRKLTERFPGLVILSTEAGPVKGVVTIRVGPKPS